VQRVFREGGRFRTLRREGFHIRRKEIEKKRKGAKTAFKGISNPIAVKDGPGKTGAERIKASIWGTTVGEKKGLRARWPSSNPRGTGIMTSN